MDRYDMFPHIENSMTMTLREWMYFHNVMHRHYTKYAGRTVLKNPFDWIVMMDIIQETKPELIIEIGCFDGGFTLWMAHFCQSLGIDTKILGADITTRPTQVSHPNIQWITGDIMAASTLAQVEEAAAGSRGLVIEDSDHKYHVTKRILQDYHKFVAPGSYFVVEDTIVEAMNLPPFPGPLNAVKEFAEANSEGWKIDRTREKYIMTYNPMGYLLRLPE